jgi:hypothetical protein
MCPRNRGNSIEYWTDASHSRQLQDYWLERANAILRTDGATERGYRDWAASELIDFGFVPSEKKAAVDERGKPVRSTEHDRYVAAIEVLAEMSRNRRSAYGHRWLAAAEESLATLLSSRSSYSPSRSCSYVWVASELGRDPDHRQVAELAVAAMHRDGTSSAIALGAPAASILATFDWLLRLCKGESVAIPDLDLSLAPVVARVRSGQNSGR